MDLRLSLSDRERWEEVKQVMAANERLLTLYSAYLRQCPCFVDRETMERMRSGGKVTEKEAFCALLSAACGLEPDENAADRNFFYRYLYPSVQVLRPEDYQNNPYYQTVRVPQKELESWTLRWQSYRPYEAFICRDPVIHRDYRQLPQLGFFTEEFSYPAVLENTVEWMTVTPNEIASMEEAVKQAEKRVLTFGLGLGYFAFMASEKKEVEQVTVVERDSRAIALFCEHILPQFPHREKISVVCEDALIYAQSQRMKSHDFVFADLWHDVSDGLPLYLHFKQREKQTPWLRWSYWIESSLLCELRREVFRQICRFEKSPDPWGPKVEGFDAVCRLLSDSYLKELAAKARPFSSGK